MEMSKLQKMLCSDAVKRGKLHYEKCVTCAQPCGYGKRLLDIMGLKHIPQPESRSLIADMLKSGGGNQSLKNRLNKHGGRSNDDG